MSITGKSGLFRAEFLARLATPVTLLLIIVLAHGFARLTWRLLPQPSYAQQLLTEEAMAVTPIAREPADYSTIAGWHLFGKLETPKLVAPAPVEKAPETRLNLRLAGVFYSAGDNGLAMIAEVGGEEHSYRQGDSVPGGARLQRILQDRVVLERNGRLETLSMPREVAAMSRPTQVQNLGSTVPAVPVTDTRVDAGDIVRELRAKVKPRPEALEDLAFASPYMENGQFVGFRLRPGRKRRLLVQLGLKSGDVLTEINGTVLKSPSQGFTLLQGMLKGDQIRIKVLRNGIERSFIFDLQ